MSLDPKGAAQLTLPLGVFASFWLLLCYREQETTQPTRKVAAALRVHPESARGNAGFEMSEVREAHVSTKVPLGHWDQRGCSNRAWQDLQVLLKMRDHHRAQGRTRRLDSSLSWPK